VSTLIHGPAGGLVGLPLLIALVVAPYLLRGVLGIRLELRADRAAGEAVGNENLANALARLAELNDTRRRTGRTWSLLNQHPGIEQRIDVLRRGEQQPVQMPARRHAGRSTGHESPTSG
jgi:Zn-dependent protease with chaperone function